MNSSTIPDAQPCGVLHYSDADDEAAFHAHLDANPDDHYTRLVFADWLQDRNDPRAEGYRALGSGLTVPCFQTDPKRSNECFYSMRLGNASISRDLPEDWFRAIPPKEGEFWNRHFTSRREAEDAAAHAFSQLSPERRAELLNQPPPTQASRYAADAQPVNYEEEPQPLTPQERERAARADLVVLPSSTSGASCGSCEYLSGGNYCRHPRVLLSVERHWCCSYFDAPGVERVAGNPPAGTSFYTRVPDAQPTNYDDPQADKGTSPLTSDYIPPPHGHIPNAQADTTTPDDHLNHPHRVALSHAPPQTVLSLKDVPEVGGAGVNGTYLMNLEGGHQGVFKPAHEEHPNLRPGVPSGTYHKREVAASVLADIMGMSDLVPKTAPREHEGAVGSIQHYVPDTRTAHRLPDEVKFDGPIDSARAALFDYVLGHEDRHEGNWLVAPNGKLVLIDNGLSLPSEYHPYVYDGTRSRILRNAARTYAPLPDTTHLRDKWPEMETALRGLGIDEPAIALTKQRFGIVTSGRHRNFGELPSFWGNLDPRYQVGTLGDEWQWNGRRPGIF